MPGAVVPQRATHTRLSQPVTPQIRRHLEVDRIRHRTSSPDGPKRFRTVCYFASVPFEMARWCCSSRTREAVVTFVMTQSRRPPCRAPKMGGTFSSPKAMPMATGSSLPPQGGWLRSSGSSGRGPVCRSCQSTARRYYRRRDPLPAALIGEEPRFWDVMRSRQDESSWLHPPRWAPVLEKNIFEGKAQLESAVM